METQLVTFYVWKDHILSVVSYSSVRNNYIINNGEVKVVVWKKIYKV